MVETTIPGQLLCSLWAFRGKENFVSEPGPELFTGTDHVL